MRSAKSVHHLRALPEDDRNYLILMTTRTMHLTKAESDIFRFIATRTEGFKPSANYIAEETGWSRMKVFDARAQLVKFGIIGETDDKILIDWNRIRLLSILDPSMTGRKCTVATVTLVR